MKTGAVATVLVAAFLVVSLTETAEAQANQCTQLASTLKTLTKNKDFGALEANTDKARTLAAQLRDAESTFVRGGCQAALNAKQKLTGDCLKLARSIVAGRDTYNKLAASIETGQAVSQQREVALQQIARFGCNQGSNAEIVTEERPKSPFASLFEQLFGGGGQRIVDDYGYNPNASTLRTVCVRSCDGYYWPISFSTVEDYLGNDAATCASQCPGSEVSLYYYHNPGEDPENMVNLAGAPYTAMPNAFRYRQEFDASCTCKAPINYGSIQIAATDNAAPGRAMVQFSETRFPLPLRDPRRQTEVSTIEAIHVPLPRPRPVRPGEQGTDTASAEPIVSTATAKNLRLIRFGDRVVRLVGPDTPYARSAEEGS